MLLGSVLLLSVPLAEPAFAHGTSHHKMQPTRGYRQASHWGTRTHGVHWARYGAGHRWAHAGGGGISCVPYARSESGIELAGNAWQWWDNAAGQYARGSVPEPGSVLSFSANGRMHLGHVAVVSRVVNAREIEIDHANWGGRVAHNMPVVDVSENNDWTAVRVAVGPGEFGSVYPTHGFIYGRPDNGVMVASNAVPAPRPDLNPAPADLRPLSARWSSSQYETGPIPYEEVAEAPALTHAWHHHRKVYRVAYHPHRTRYSG
jgi:surface antigen